MIAPTPSPSRDWSFIVLKADGHGLAAQIQQGLDTLDRAGTSPDAWITVRAEQEAKATDYTLTDGAGPHHLAHAQGGATAEDTRSHPVLSADAIKAFLLNTMRQYPAKHVLVSFDGHSHALRQAIGPMHEALAAAMAASGHKIDVLVLDACFMAQVESASEFQDVADYLVASQESMEGSRAVEKLAQEVAAKPIDARAVAAELVSESQEATLSALDLSKTPDLERRMRGLGRALRGLHDEAALRAVRADIEASQHFYTLGWSHPHPFHNTVDLCDFTTRMASDPVLARQAPALARQGAEVAAAARASSNGFVFAEKHTDRVVSQSGTLDYSDVRNAHGVSIFMPFTAPILRDAYTHFPHSRFNEDTGWDAAIAHVTGERSPGFLEASAEENESGLAWAGAELGLTTLQETAARVGDWVKQRFHLHAPQPAGG